VDFYFFESMFRKVEFHEGKEKYFSGERLLDKRGNEDTGVDHEPHYILL
jgi:hypothetical protein